MIDSHCHLDHDPLFENIPIIRNKLDNVDLGCVLSNSFGFGGTNASLTFKHPDL